MKGRQSGGGGQPDHDADGRTICCIDRERRAPRDARRSGGRRLVEVVTTWSTGLVLLAAGIAATITADVGVGPLDVMSTAIMRRTGMDIGLAIALINAFMAVSARLIGGRLGAATIATAVALGPMVDVWLDVIGSLPVTFAGVAAWALLAAGILLVGAGGSVQISSGWGPSPLDALVVAIAGTRWTLRRVRTAVELSFALGGAIAGGALGLGTLVVAVGVGPALAVWMRLLAPLRARFGT